MPGQIFSLLMIPMAPTANFSPSVVGLRTRVASRRNLVPKLSVVEMVRKKFIETLLSSRSRIKLKLRPIKPRPPSECIRWNGVHERRSNLRQHACRMTVIYQGTECEESDKQIVPGDSEPSTKHLAFPAKPIRSIPRFRSLARCS